MLDNIEAYEAQEKRNQKYGKINLNKNEILENNKKLQKLQEEINQQELENQFLYDALDQNRQFQDNLNIDDENYDFDIKLGQKRPKRNYDDDYYDDLNEPAKTESDKSHVTKYSRGLDLNPGGYWGNLEADKRISKKPIPIYPTGGYNDSKAHGKEQHVKRPKVKKPKEIKKTIDQQTINQQTGEIIPSQNYLSLSALYKNQ